ncbi:hypothetical protein EOM09_09055 [bacterium]|nr:hypothetical protein [bacterium]
MIKTTIWREVSKVPVPIGEWFELEYYIKEGNNNDGRFVLSIRKDGQKKQKIFDITNWTHHSKATYTDGFQSIDPLKMYTSNDITDHIRNRGGALQFYWDDFRFYSGDNRES